MPLDFAKFNTSSGLYLSDILADNGSNSGFFLYCSIYHWLVLSKQELLNLREDNDKCKSNHSLLFFHTANLQD